MAMATVTGTAIIVRHGCPRTTATTTVAAAAEAAQILPSTRSMLKYNNKVESLPYTQYWHV